MSTPTSTSGGQSSSEATGYSSPTSVPPSGNGKSPQTAAWSSALTLDPNTKKTYVVDGLGLFPRYRRTTLVDARSAAQVYTVLNGDTYQAVTQLPPGPMANPTMPAATGEAAQIAEIGTHETVVASGTAPAAIQYTETQAAHGDAFQDSNDNAGNSPDEQGDHSSSSSSSGAGSSVADSSN